MGFDLSETDRLLTTTRAVRRRLDFERPVERSVVLECIGIAQQAPTASNSQGWRWLVVTDAGIRAQLAEIYRRIGSAALPAGRGQVAEEDRQSHRVYDSAEYLMEHLAEAPVLVIPCVEGRLDASAPVGMQAALYGSIYPAIWSFQLALRSRGLGTVLTTVHLFAENEVAELLGIPEGTTQAALMPVAYTKGDDFKAASRPPAETITFWNHWTKSR